MNNQQHPCLCDICLKARDEELERVRNSYESINNLGLSKKDLLRITTQSSIDQMKAHEKYIRQKEINDLIQFIESFRYVPGTRELSIFTVNPILLELKNKLELLKKEKI